MKRHVPPFLAAFLAVAVLSPSAASAQDARAKLHALFDEEWEFRLREDPLFATSTGDHRYDDRLPRVSLAEEKRRTDFRRSLLGKLRAIDPRTLQEADRVSHGMFEWELRDAIEGFERKRHLMPLTADSG